MAKPKRSCWHLYPCYRFKKTYKNRIVVATTNGWYFSTFIGSHSLFIRNCYRENCFAHPSALRLRCLLFSAPLRANTTLSVNNWPILYVSISASDATRKGCAWAREVCNSCVHHRADCPASTRTQYRLARRGFYSLFYFFRLASRPRNSFTRETRVTRDYGMNFLQTS